MKTNRMFEAVRPFQHPILAYLYAVIAVFLSEIFMDIGFEIGDVFLTGATSVAAVESLLLKSYALVDQTYVELFLFIFPALLLVLWVKVVERRPIRGLGFYKEGWFKHLAIGWGIGCLMMTATVGLIAATGAIRFKGLYFTLMNIVSFVWIAPFWLLQSGVEELLTRGWLFPVVSRQTKLPLGLFASSVLFSLMHLGNPGINPVALLNLALFGLVACLYLLKTDTIWGVAGIHAAWNCFQGNFFGLEVSGLPSYYPLMSFETQQTAPSYFSGGGFGPEGTLLASLVLVVVSLWLAVDLCRSKKLEWSCCL